MLEKGIEIGASLSIIDAVKDQNESEALWRYFNLLLSRRDYVEARTFADEQEKIGRKMFMIVLDDLEDNAKKQIDRP